MSNNNSEYLLYTNNTGRKSFQWELWQCCNSQCKFCYIGTEVKVRNKERQLTSLHDLSKMIDTLDFNEYNNISLIGGEFFQGQLDDPDVNREFFKVITKIFNLYVEKKIGSIWMTITLTIGDQKDLYKLLDLADRMGVHPLKEYGASGLWLCTSWDAAGRFHTQKMEDNWNFHMKNIKKKYPWIKFNTTIILQQAFIDKYNNNEFKPKEFMKEYNTTLFFKQCGIPDVKTEGLIKKNDDADFEDYWLYSKKMYNKEVFKFDFFPTRASFVKFLNKFYHEDNEIFERLFNIKFRSDELHRNFNKDEHDISLNRVKDGSSPEESGIRLLKCGHIFYYAPYIDNNKCCICDRNIIAGGI